jgi:hypothetical protein
MSAPPAHLQLRLAAVQAWKRITHHISTARPSLATTLALPPPTAQAPQPQDLPLLCTPSRRKLVPGRRPLTGLRTQARQPPWPSPVAAAQVLLKIFGHTVTAPPSKGTGPALLPANPQRTRLMDLAKLQCINTTLAQVARTRVPSTGHSQARRLPRFLPLQEASAVNTWSTNLTTMSPPQDNTTQDRPLPYHSDSVRARSFSWKQERWYCLLDIFDHVYKHDYYSFWLIKWRVYGVRAVQLDRH